ncbi:MAG: SPOCS domain-containing protein [Clostridium sp.]
MSCDLNKDCTNIDCTTIDACVDNLILEKTVSKENAIVGDVIKYCITVINECDILIDNATIIDMLSSDLKFVTGSVKVGEIPNITANVLEGVDIGCLKPGEIKVVSFQAKIINKPCTGYIENNAIAKFYYDPNLNNCLQVTDKKSNVVKIKVDVAELSIVKKADKTIASRGDIVSYTVTVTNVGTLEARNILFMDNIPNEATLIKDSLDIGGNLISYTSSDISIYIGNLFPGESIDIRYQVLVNSSNCSGLLVNCATAKFNYNLCNSSFGEKTSSCADTSVSEVKLGISTFKQISVDQNLCIPSVKPDMEEINDIKVKAEIVECHVINTPVITSNEGQSLSGYKLIVRGLLTELVEYTSCTEEQSVHSAHYSIPFSTFIVLPQNYIAGSKIDVDAIVEDVYYKMIDCRCFFKNITLLINARIMSC